MKLEPHPSLAVFFGVAALFAPMISSLADAASRNVVVLYRFSGGADGGNPYGPLIADQAGNLYGTTEFGGSSGFGVVFELTPNGDRNGAWTETVLHSFNGSDGAYPNYGLKRDSQGNLYGTTFSGTGAQNGGIAFELSPGGNGAWTFTLLNSFGGPLSSAGSNPNGDLAIDSSGNLYGTTQLGGNANCTNFPGPCGVVFELSPAQNGNWSETVLYNFRGPSDGSFPYSGVVLDAIGNLYGTTNEGGSGKCNDGEGTVIGCGTVFELTPSQNGWSETHLYDFRNSEQNGPYGPAAFGYKGALYGTAGYDVFRLKPRSDRNWKKGTVYEFTEGIAGTIPSSAVTFDRRGNLHGTTSSSGLDGYSTVFELSPPGPGGGPWMLTNLAQFGKGFDSNQPRGGVLLGKDGTIFGAVSGTAERGYIFAITR